MKKDHCSQTEAKVSMHKELNPACSPVTRIVGVFTVTPCCTIPQDAEQQKEWEEQMEHLRQQRLLEFASARPSIDASSTEGKPFFIASPPEPTSPLGEKLISARSDWLISKAMDDLKKMLTTPDPVGLQGQSTIL